MRRLPLPAQPVSVPRHAGRATLVDIDIDIDLHIKFDVDTRASTAPARAAALQHTIDRTLTTSVHVVHDSASAGRSPVTRLRHLNLQQVAALEVSGGPMRLANALSHPGAVFFFTLVSGSCALSCEAGEARLQSGEFVVLRGDRTMTAVHGAPFLVRGTRIPAGQLERELADWPSAELVPVNGRSGAGALLLALQDHLLTHGSALTSRAADAYVQTLSCLLADALRGVLPPAVDALHTQAEHHRRRIRAYVREHLADAGLDIAAIAAGVALSPAHVHRLFAAEPTSLRSWIQAERLDACRAALLDPADALRPVTDVALAWGFRDPAHFSRSFKLRFGLSPRAARQAALRAGAVGPDDLHATGTIS